MFAAIVDALGLGCAAFTDPAVKRADDWCLAAEAWHLMASRGESWWCAGLYDPARESIPWRLGMDYETAENLWLYQHNALMRRLSIHE